MRTIAILQLAVCVALCLGQDRWRIRQVADIPSGRSGSGGLPCGDMDHDSLPDFTFGRGTPGMMLWRWEVWECLGHNGYVLVKAETCVGDPYPPPGMSKGTFHPEGMGDIDGDGLADVLGANAEYFYSGNQMDSVRLHLCVYESPAPDSYPDTLVWAYCFGSDAAAPSAWLPGDLDGDGRREIVAYAGTGVTYVFENRGDNRNDLVFTTPFQHYGYDYAFGDFDLDGATEFAFAPVWSDFLYVYECDGDDHYALADSLRHGLENGADVFSGRDVDGDGRPEFFVVYTIFTDAARFYIMMYEATGNNTYEGVLIDSMVSGDNATSRNSVCADVDGDGAEELVVSFISGVRIYEATGNNQFRWVWQWFNPTPGAKESYVQCHDMNRNGYQDIVVSGSGHTWVFEMEAIKVVAPNRRVDLVPGETCDIRWCIYTPSRCDSVSLFLRRDTLWPWVLDTIATGLSPLDSVYPWRVPPGPADSCRIVAIAYGPGWQYDESDSAFRILPGGVAELAATPVRDWALLVSPNPLVGYGTIGYDAPVAADIRLSLFDAAGRKVAELKPGANDVRHLTSGVYFIRAESKADGDELSVVAKVLIMK